MPAAVSRTFSASALAAACGGRLVGEDVPAVGRVRSLEAAGPGDLAFATDVPAQRRAASCAAGVVLAHSAGLLAGRTVIEAADPSAALAAILWLFHPRRAVRPGVHPTAVFGKGTEVDPTAEVGPYAVLGEGVRLGPGCVVGSHSVVGDGCVLGAGTWLHPHVVLYDGVLLGERTEVHSGAVLGADGFGYAPTPRGIAKIPQVGTVEVGADAEIGANTCVDRATLEVTRIGAGTKLDNLIQVGHNCEIGRHVVICGQVGLAGSTVVGDGAQIAGQVGTAGHVRIGSRSRVGGQSGIFVDVPDGNAAFGSPAFPAREAMRATVELRRLPETARLVRVLAAKAGLLPGSAEEK